MLVSYSVKTYKNKTIRLGDTVRIKGYKGLGVVIGLEMSLGGFESVCVDVSNINKQVSWGMSSYYYRFEGSSFHILSNYKTCNKCWWFNFNDITVIKANHINKLDI